MRVWPRRRPRTLVELLVRDMSRPDPYGSRLQGIDIAGWMYPLEHRHAN